MSNKEKNEHAVPTGKVILIFGIVLLGVPAYFVWRSRLKRVE